jgi:hypothetical protein
MVRPPNADHLTRRGREYGPFACIGSRLQGDRAARADAHRRPRTFDVVLMDMLADEFSSPVVQELVAG